MKTARGSVLDGRRIRIGWRDFPCLGRESTMAPRAAAVQGRFRQNHDALYRRQSPANSGRLTDDHVVQLAGSLGLDTAGFRADMKSPRTAEESDSDLKQDLALGIMGPPAVLAGRTPIMGAQPEVVFAKAIDDALRKAA